MCGLLRPTWSSLRCVAAASPPRCSCCPSSSRQAPPGASRRVLRRPCPRLIKAARMAALRDTVGRKRGMRGGGCPCWKQRSSSSSSPMSSALALATACGLVKVLRCLHHRACSGLRNSLSSRGMMVWCGVVGFTRLS